MLSLEKELLKKNYVSLNKEKEIFKYVKKNNETMQVILEKKENRYKFSFPMPNNKINYAVYFINKEKLDNYMSYIIKNYIT